MAVLLNGSRGYSTIGSGSILALSIGSILALSTGSVLTLSTGSILAPNVWRSSSILLNKCAFLNFRQNYNNCFFF